MRARDQALKLNVGGIFGDDHSRWAQIVNGRFNLGIDPKVFRVATGFDVLEPLIGSVAAAKLAGMARPGFQAVAELALHGLTGQSVSADALQAYDAPNADAPFLAAVIESISVFDDAGISNAERAEVLQRLILAFERARAFLSAEYQKAGLLEAIGLAVASLALALQLIEMNSGPPPVELQEANSHLAAILTELQSSRDGEASGSRSIRFVRQVTHLRAEPHRDGLVVRLVYPDQWVRVIDTNGEWARVEVFDYRSDAGIEGWINRRNLRMKPE